jgi:cytochrome b involved in lipid metabolism
MTEFANEAAVLALHTRDKKEIIIFEGSVYDITEYKNVHPGGAAYFNDYFGKSIDEPFESEGHSTAARRIFRDLPCIGYITGTNQPKIVGDADCKEMKSTFKIDYERGLLD